MSSQRSLIVRAGALVLAGMFGALTAGAQTQEIDQLRERLRQLEQSTQQSMQDMKAQIAALEAEAQRPPGVAPALPAPLPSTVPTAQLPLNIGEETRLRQTAGENEDGAPRIDNEPLDPELRGYFRLPGTTTLMKFG